MPDLRKMLAVALLLAAAIGAHGQPRTACKANCGSEMGIVHCIHAPRMAVTAPATLMLVKSIAALVKRACRTCLQCSYDCPCQELLAQCRHRAQLRRMHIWCVAHVARQAELPNIEVPN
jgi:hypothetical protein